MNKTTAVVLTVLSAAVLYANPMEFRSYKQDFTLKFATPQEAEKAVIVPRKLPGDYDLAFSSRWDDTTMSHVNTFKIMKKYGAKGNFYLGRNVNSDAPVIREVIRDGCLAGCHTVNHYQTSMLCANEHFYEYMANRIGIEVLAQHPVNTQASPFGQLYGISKEGTESIGRALFATGIIGFPDRSNPQQIKDIGYPENAFAFMFRIVPGDRVPDMNKYRRTLAAYMKDPRLEQHPGLALSTHSWHTKEGLVLLDEIYRELTSNKNWWNCNQNEYAAYRYEFKNSIVEKKIDGNSVRFTVTRFEPFELGADVPLTLELQNSSAVSADGAKLFANGKKIELPHASGHKIPDVYAYNNEKHGIKGISLVLKKQGDKLTAAITNKTNAVLGKSCLTFRLPPDNSKLAVREDISDIASGKEATACVALKKEKNSLHYDIGSHYYAVQFDFVMEGKRYRLFADLKEKAAVAAAPRTINEAAAYFCEPKNADYAKLSLPQSDLKGSSLALLKREVTVCTANAICPGRVLSRSRNFAAVIEFTSDKEKELTLPVSMNSGKENAIWLNGSRLKTKGSNKVKIVNGKNRLVIRCPRNRACKVALPLSDGLKLLPAPCAD